MLLPGSEKRRAAAVPPWIILYRWLDSADPQWASVFFWIVMNSTMVSYGRCWAIWCFLTGWSKESAQWSVWGYPTVQPQQPQQFQGLLPRELSDRNLGLNIHVQIHRLLLTKNVLQPLACKYNVQDSYVDALAILESYLCLFQVIFWKSTLFVFGPYERGYGPLTASSRSWEHLQVYEHIVISPAKN